MRISDWSSDGCSSDLLPCLRRGGRKSPRPKPLLPIRGLLHHAQVAAAARRWVVVVRTAHGRVGRIGCGIRTGLRRFAAAADILRQRHALPGLAGVESSTADIGPVTGWLTPPKRAVTPMLSSSISRLHTPRSAMLRTTPPSATL